MKERSLVNQMLTKDLWEWEADRGFGSSCSSFFDRFLLDLVWLQIA